MYALEIMEQNLQISLIWLVLILTISNFSISSLVQFNHLATIFRKPGKIHKAGLDAVSDEPFISIHVPTYDEPADLVIETLKSLARLDYGAYEVIVLDNNTPSPETWRPVQQACFELGERFRFFHFDNVKGAKAGALNIGLNLCRHGTRYVAVVDADYQVSPDFLSLAVSTFRGTGAAFVQFPQAYRHVGLESAFVADELSDYFNAFAPRANNDLSMLLTGTLSVISLSDLKAIGGWSGETVTEDAELGVRFFENHFYGVYNPTVVGRGLLPLSFKSLTAQRRRWVTGNLQTLIGVLRRRGAAGSPNGFATIIAQLTAWPAFWLLPILNLAVIAAFGDGHDARIGFIRDLSALTILIVAVSVGWRISLDTQNRARSVQSIASILAVKLSLVWTSSTAFLPAIWKKSIAFVRTPKMPTAGSDRSDPNFILGLVGFTSTLIYLRAGNWLAALSCLLIFGIAPATIWVERSLKAYAVKISSKS